MTEEIPVKDNIGGNDSTRNEPGTGRSDTPSTHSHPNQRELVLADMSREEAIRRLHVFYRLTRAIGDSNHNVDRMAQSVAQLISEVIGDMAVITVLSMDREQYRIAGYHEPDPDVLSLYEEVLKEVGPVPRTQGWVAQVIESGQPLRTGPLSTEEVDALALPAFSEFNRKVGMADMLIVPITGRSGTLGAITIRRHRGGRRYDENDQAFLMEIAYRVAVEIENFTLIESLRQQIGARAFAGEALAASEQRFLSIFHAAIFGIKLMDLVGTILETNAAFQAMSGYDERELLAMHFYDIVHPDDLAAALGAFGKVKSRKQPYVRLEHRLLRKDGSAVWVRTTYAGVKKSSADGGLSLIFGIVENISEQKKAEQDLRELQRHIQTSVELERLRLAQNLHDAPLQELYAVIYKLEEVRLRSTDSGSIELLRESVAEMKKTLESLRATASELRPPALSRFGLERAIRSYSEDFKLKHPEIRLKLTLAHDAQMLDEPVRLVLFRVFQEALANVVRHTQATRVEVNFSFDAEEARIEIADNGRGFKVPPNWMSNVRTGHYGFAGMAERVGAAGGLLTIDSSPETSTTVRAVIPCLKN